MEQQQLPNGIVVPAPASHLIFRCLLDHMPHFIFWKDTRSRYLGCNQAYADLLGLVSPADLIGQTDDNLGWQPTGDTAGFFQSVDRATLLGDCLQNVEQELHLPGKPPLTVLVNKQPLRDARQKIIGVLGIALDISAKRALQKAQRRQSHYLSNLRHDLRTPISAMLGSLQTLHNTASTQSIRQEIEQLIQTTRSLLSVCNIALKKLNSNEIKERHASTTSKKSITQTQPRKPLQGRLLIVEDHPIMLRAARLMLEQQGDFMIDTANNAKQAIVKVEQHHYDLILLDLGLPDHDGLWLTQRLRTGKKAPPIFALSAHMDEALAQTCLQAGMKAALTKPLTAHMIHQVLSPYLSSSQERTS